VAARNLYQMAEMVGNVFIPKSLEEFLKLRESNSNQFFISLVKRVEQLQKQTIIPQKVVVYDRTANSRPKQTVAEVFFDHPNVFDVVQFAKYALPTSRLFKLDIDEEVSDSGTIYLSARYKDPTK